MASSKRVQTQPDFVMIVGMIHGMEQLVSAVSSLASTVSGAVDKAYAGVEAMTESLSKQKRKETIARQYLKAVNDCASRFLKEAETLIQIGGNKKRIENIITCLSKTKRRAKILWKVRNPNFENLLEFIEEMKRALSAIKKAYRLFTEKIKAAIQFISETALECDDYARKAQDEKEKTELTGAITTPLLTVVAMIAGGVLAGPLGVFLGAATANIAGENFTKKIADRCEAQRQAFNRQLTILNEFLESADKIEDTVKTYHLKVDFLASAVGKIQHNWKKKTLDALCENLSQLLK